MKRGPERQQPEHSNPRDINGPLKRAAAEIGLGPMDNNQRLEHFYNFKKQLGNGLHDEGNPRLQAIKTRIQPVSLDVWSQVPSGERALVGEFGGENIKVRLAQKGFDGLVTVSEPLYSDTIPRDQRQVPFDTFINRIASPLAEHVGLLDKERPVNIGLSVGLPHENRRTDTGIEVHLQPTEDGDIKTKENVIIDWASIPPQEREIMQAVGKRVATLRPGSRIGALVGANDTPGVALDTGAAESALGQMQALGQKGRVLNAGGVGGTGTNFAFLLEQGENKRFNLNTAAENAGLVNTEIGQGAIKDNEVSKRMRQRLIDKGLLAPADNHPKIEHETGQYLPLRLAAGIELLAETDNFPDINAPALTETIIKQAQKQPSLMSDLATNKTRLTANAEVNEALQIVAQGVMERSAQMYGILYATTAEPIQTPAPNQEFPDAFLTEGSTILKGQIDENRTVKNIAEEVSASLGHKITIYEASGVAGIAGLTMAQSEMRDAA